MNKSEKSFSIESIEDIIQGHECEIRGDSKNLLISNAALVGECNQNSIVWLGRELYEFDISIIEKIRASVIITDLDLNILRLNHKCVIVKTDKPRLIFSKIISKLFATKYRGEIHKSAVIHRDAEISPGVYIGPNCTIGNSIIGKGTVLVGNIFVHDKVVIGENCFIGAGTVIGSEGFGHIKDNNNIWFKFPHLGGTIIEDNVEIGANTYINRGTLGNTRISQQSKIAHSVCIGHNVIVGKNTIVLSNAIIGGSTVIGEDCWISISASIKHGLNIGSKSVVGMGAIVLNDVHKGKTVVGNPARELVK